MDNNDSSGERLKFEAVWKRVTAHSDETINDYMVPAKSKFLDNNPEAQTLPEVDDAELIRQLIEDEAYISDCYRSLACKMRGAKYYGILYRLYIQGNESLKKLKASYFLLTGETLKVPVFKHQGRNPLEVLHSLYWKETESSQAIHDASQTIKSDKLAGLLSTISALKRSQLDELETLIERLMI